MFGTTGTNVDSRLVFFVRRLCLALPVLMLIARLVFFCQATVFGTTGTNVDSRLCFFVRRLCLVLPVLMLIAGFVFLLGDCVWFYRY